MKRKYNIKNISTSLNYLNDFNKKKSSIIDSIKKEYSQYYEVVSKNSTNNNNKFRQHFCILNVLKRNKYDTTLNQTKKFRNQKNPKMSRKIS